MIYNGMTHSDMARLHHACFAHMRAWPAAEIAEILENGHSFALSCENAFLIARAVAGEAEILTLAVDPAARRMGLGRDLVQRFKATARQKGASLAFLEVAADNKAAIALYGACGFAQSGRRRDYYRTATGCAVDALVMTCQL